LEAVQFGSRAEYLKKQRQAEERRKRENITTDQIVPNNPDLLKSLGLTYEFKSTRGKHVPDACAHYVALKTNLKYRQYMNRKGAFGKPLPAEKVGGTQ